MSKAVDHGAHVSSMLNGSILTAMLQPLSELIEQGIISTQGAED